LAVDGNDAEHPAEFLNLAPRDPSDGQGSAQAIIVGSQLELDFLELCRSTSSSVPSGIRGAAAQEDIAPGPGGTKSE
jgi:hypothetical protein